MSAHATTFTPDAYENTATVGDYFTLLKPRVMSLVIFTGLCGFLIAPGSLHPLIAFTALLCIAVGAGGSGCLNMWYERTIDARMIRTQGRPIPTGRIQPDDALIFGVMLSFLSVLVMLVAVNPLAAALLAFTIFYYVVIYTIWLKPLTPQNIVIGGAAGALPPVIAWAAVTNSISFQSLSLFLIIFLWTPPHFWALALLTQEDYKRAGIPMLPNVVGEQSTKRQIIVYTLATALGSYAPSILGLGGLLYISTATILNAVFIVMAIRLLRTDTIKGRKPAIQLFAYSIFYLFSLFLVLTLDCLVIK